MKNNIRIKLAIFITALFVLSCGTKNKNRAPAPDEEKIEEIEIEDNTESEASHPVEEKNEGGDSKGAGDSEDAGSDDDDDIDIGETAEPKYTIGMGTGTAEQAFCSEGLSYKNELLTVLYPDYDSICVLEAAENCSRPVQDLCLEAPGGSRYPEELKAFPGASFKVMTDLDRGTSLGDDKQCICPAPAE